MQPLRQRIIDSTGAHPLRANTPVQARAPTHAPLAATSGSRIHGTRDRASAFPTLQDSTTPPTPHPAYHRTRRTRQNPHDSLRPPPQRRATTREHTGNGQARRSDVIHSETTAAAAAAIVCRVFATMGRAHRRRHACCVSGWVGVAGCHVFYAKPDTWVYAAERQARAHSHAGRWCAESVGVEAGFAGNACAFRAAVRRVCRMYRYSAPTTI